jgi:hypothetical protein
MLEAKSTICPTVCRTVGDMTRLCAHPLCSQQAAFTLSYEYRQGQVWIDELSGDRNPHTYDLCRRHTGSLTVPLGWQAFDRRGSLRAADSAADRGAVEGAGPGGAEAMQAEPALAGYGYR